MVVGCGLSPSVVRADAPLSAASVTQVITKTVPHNPHVLCTPENLNTSWCHFKDRQRHVSVRYGVSNLPATGETFESEFVADDIRGTGTVEIIATHLPVLLPSSNSAEFSYREGGRGDDCSLSVLSTFHAWDCSYTLLTNIRQTNHRSTSSLCQII